MTNLQNTHWKMKTLPRILAVVLLALAIVKLSNNVIPMAHYFQDQIVIVAQIATSKLNLSIDFTTIKKLLCAKK